MKKAVIVCGGRTDHGFALDYIKQEEPDYLIAADSGMEFFFLNDLCPDLCIGDFDSVTAPVLEHFLGIPGVQVQRLSPEKDETDTEAAIFAAISEGCDRIDLLGSTGSRIDHMLGNIHLLGIGFEEHVILRMVDGNNRIQMIKEQIQIKRNEQLGKYVSLLPFQGPVRGVTLKGMKYPLVDADLPVFRSLGISNEIQDEIAEIRIKEGILLVIESRDEMMQAGTSFRHFDPGVMKY